MAAKAHFSVLGFPVRVHPFFWLVIIMLSLPSRGGFTKADALNSALWAVVVFVSILWHELGHALMMKRHGYSPWIELYGMGGRTGWGRGPGFPSPKVRILVSLAGPFAGFLLGGAVWVASLAMVSGENAVVDDAIRLMLWANLGWGLVNLVPMLPWDGGHAMHGALDWATKGQGRKAAGVVTLVVAALCGALLLWLRPTGSVFWLWFLLLVSVENGVRAIRGPKPRPATKSAPAAEAAPKDVYLAIRAGLHKFEGEHLIDSVFRRQTTPSWLEHAPTIRKYADEAGDERPEVLEVAAWAFLLGGDAAGAAEAVGAMLPEHDPSIPLAALVALEEERFEDIVALREGTSHLPKTVLAYALFATRRHDEAWALVEETRALGHHVDAALFYRGRYDDAADLGARMFEAFAHASDAYNVACSYAQLGRIDEGIEWLERAVDTGLEAPEQLDEDEDLAALRTHGEFARVRERALGGGGV